MTVLSLKICLLVGTVDGPMVDTMITMGHILDASNNACVLKRCSQWV